MKTGIMSIEAYMTVAKEVLTEISNMWKASAKY